jgi:mannitol-specific phosphotransferase system IIBC component
MSGVAQAYAYYIFHGLSSLAFQNVVYYVVAISIKLRLSSSSKRQTQQTMAAMRTAMKAAKPTIFEVDTSNGLQHLLFETPDGSIPKMWCKRFGIRFTGQVRKVKGSKTFTWRPDWRFQISAMSASKRKQVIKEIKADDIKIKAADIKLAKQKQKQAMKEREAAMQAKERKAADIKLAKERKAAMQAKKPAMKTKKAAMKTKKAAMKT